MGPGSGRQGGRWWGWPWHCGHGMDCTMEITGLCPEPPQLCQVSAQACGLCGGTDTCRPQKTAQTFPQPLFPSESPWRDVWAHSSVFPHLSVCCLFLGPSSPSVPVTYREPWWSSWKSTWKAQVFEALRAEHLEDRPSFFLLILPCVTSIPCSANKVFISLSPCPGLSHHWG